MTLQDDLRNKTQREAALLKADHLAKVDPGQIIDGKLTISVSGLRYEKGWLVIDSITATNSGVPVDFGDQLPWSVFNPPVMARTGNKKQVQKEMDGELKMVEEDEFEFNPTEALKQIIVDKVRRVIANG